MRRLHPGLLVLATALLLLSDGALQPGSQVALAQSGGGYDLTWWTTDAGGGAISGSGYALNGIAGQPEAGPVPAGGGYALAGGFWPGGPASPLAVADLRASKSGNLLRLDWTAVTGDVEGNSISGVTYNIYRAQDAPYFVAGAPYGSGVTGTTYTDPDTNVIGNTQHSYYYLIRAVHSGMTSSDSNRVGSFAFGLTPGSF